ncbi:hypothetical protein EG359_17255 [Chryseobacterium joostei]|uniref:Uncharacterized protein n=1 Tax=Chryseobacterium joostei TaxID=112234 RepID=A0A1N7IAW3_9FLAO|nr:hypothetical protein [Chryseobacterium joostei]AZB01252.1 hypothetical protein EG359_17255 [Chryseobacterium joostei]SIS34214.1 hypothetical protein SAMN05421768_103648 [Chryseobacterium joostei]
MSTNVKQKLPNVQIKGPEISKKRAEKIARNINAMNTDYQRLDDRRSWRFWKNLESVLRKKISSLSINDIEVIKPLLNPVEAEFFNLN